MRFSEWIQIESFLDIQIREIALREALSETFASVIKEARKALLHGTILEGSDDEEEDERRKRLLLSIRNSIMAIRTYGIIERRRLVDFMKEISEWISKSKQDDDLDDLKTDAFYEVLPKSDLVHIKTKLEKDTLEIAAVILKRLNYITASEESEIVGDLAEEGQKAEAAMEFLEDKVNRAASETGNDIDQGSVSFGKAKADYEKASEDLRRDTIELYRYNIEIKTARDAGRRLATDQELYDSPNKTSPIKNYEQDELFDEFYLRLLKKAKERRKRRDGSFFPWVPDNNEKSSDNDESSAEGNKRNSDEFQKALEDLDDEHLDRYLKRMIDSDSRTIRIRRSRTSQTNPLKNMSRKKKLIEEDIKKDSLPTSMDFYKKYMEGGENDISSASDSEIENMKIGLEKPDKIRIDILKDIKYISENDPRAKEFGISMNPDKIQDSLLGYMIHVLNSRRERTETPFSQFARDEDGSSEDAVVASIQGSEFEDHMPKGGSGEDSGPMSVSSSTPGTSSIATQFPIARFFRPYILRGVTNIGKKISGGRSPKNVTKAMVLCIKYNIPFSVALNEGNPYKIEVLERENFDNDLDERIKHYIFSNMEDIWSCSCGRIMGFKNKGKICERCNSAVVMSVTHDGMFGFGNEKESTIAKTLGTEKWSHEDHEKATRRTIRDDSFCKWFFYWMSGSGSSIYPPHRTIDDIMNILSIILLDKQNETVSYNPGDFTSPVTLPEGIRRRWGSSWVGETLSGQNPASGKTIVGETGADADLCDEIFNMISRDSVSLKDMIMARQKEKVARAQEKEKRVPFPSRPVLSSKPNPLGGFVRRQEPNQPEEPSSP